MLIWGGRRVNIIEKLALKGLQYLFWTLHPPIYASSVRGTVVEIQLQDGVLVKETTLQTNKGGIDAS